MLLYASDPSTINQRPQFELNSGLTTIDQACTQEWCRIVEISGRRNQRRPPAHDTEWQFLTSRFVPAIHDIIKVHFFPFIQFIYGAFFSPLFFHFHVYLRRLGCCY